MTERKQLAINICANFIYMLINYGITFFLTSFVVSEISGEAYGFIGMCNNIVNYATIVTIALNSVAGRFITINVHNGQTNKAMKYFSSTLVADLVICAGILAIFVPLSFGIDVIFDVPEELVGDVRALFLLVTFNLIINVICSVYSVSTFITNKLYLSSFASATGNIIRAILLFVFMNYVKPSIVFVGVATITSSSVVLLLNCVYTRILCPDLQINIKLVSFDKIRELVSSGIWNSITKLAQILSDGLDLVISNVWIGAYSMGQLSIAYTVPTIVSAFISMIINVFNPKLTEYYAKGDKERVVKELKINMKMTAFFGNVIFFGIIFVGKDFFNLWVPRANIDMVYRLAILATVSVLVSAIVSPLSNVFLLTNKLKLNSLVWLGVSFIDAVIVLILVNATSFGVYAVAGVSKIVGAGVNIIFLPMYASHCLDVSPMAFYKVVIRYSLSTVFVGVIMGLYRSLIVPINDWGFFLINVVAMGIIGMLVNYFFFFEENERRYFKNTIQKKILH